MTRPKSKVKGRTPPMSSPNGNSMTPNVPPDIVWDEDSPPLIFSCSQHTEHDPRCKGDCESEFITNRLQVELMNEGRAWARAGMSFLGIPSAYEAHTPVPGIHVELFDLECKVQALLDFVVDSVGVDREVLEDKFREFKLDALRRIREINEESVRRQRAEASLGIINRPGLLGPDGRPI